MKSIKKLFAVVLAIALIVSCFVMNASAATSNLLTLMYDGTVHCTGSKDGNDATLAKDTYGVSWDATEKAWIFDNTEITKQVLIDKHKNIPVMFVGECTVIVKGTCDIYGGVGVEDYEDQGTYDVLSKAILTIKGDGTLNLTGEDSCIWSGNTVKFEGKVNVNAVSNDAYVCIHANQEVIFDLDKGGKVTAETKKDEENVCAFNAAAATTIILNREDGTDVTFPVGGKETKISNTHWVITEADGETYAKKATVENKYVEYEIKESADEATWTKGAADGQKITSTADFSKFVSVSVDGKVVDVANFTAASGSTIITFKPAYLETLTVGKHTVVITSKDGSATGTLTIKEKAAEKVADTSDNSMVGVFVALGTISACGYVSMKKKHD